MADSEELREVAPTLLQDIDVEIANILKDVSSCNKQDITMSLINIERGKEVLASARKDVFDSAIERLMAFVDSDLGIQHIENDLKLKDRRGNSSRNTLADDIYELYIYAVGLEDTFPRSPLQSMKKESEMFLWGNKGENNVTRVSLSNLGDISSLKKRLDERDRQINELQKEFGLMQLKYNREITSLHEKITNISKDTTKEIIELHSVIANLRESVVLKCENSLPVSHTTEINSEHSSVDNTDNSVNDTVLSAERNTSIQQNSVQEENNTVGANEQDQLQRHVNTNNPTHSQSGSSTVSKPTYAALLGQQGPWLIQGSRNAKKNVTGQRNTTQNKPVENAGLQGVAREEATVMYVSNIKVNSRNYTVVSESVKKHVLSKGIRVMNVKIIRNRVCEDNVGCKITVPKSYACKLKETSFWPEYIVCREWEPRKKLRNNLRWHDKNSESYELSGFERGFHSGSRWYNNNDDDYFSYNDNSRYNYVDEDYD